MGLNHKKDWLRLNHEELGVNVKNWQSKQVTIGISPAKIGIWSGSMRLKQPNCGFWPTKSEDVQQEIWGWNQMKPRTAEDISGHPTSNSTNIKDFTLVLTWPSLGIGRSDHICPVVSPSFLVDQWGPASGFHESDPIEGDTCSYFDFAAWKKRSTGGFHGGSHGGSHGESHGATFQGHQQLVHRGGDPGEWKRCAQ